MVAQVSTPTEAPIDPELERILQTLHRLDAGIVAVRRDLFRYLAAKNGSNGQAR